MSDNRLFVGNLSFQTSEGDLRNYFAPAGVVSSVSVIQDKFSGRSRGFAFVEMATGEEARQAVTLFHDKDFQGRILNVNVARPREDRPPR